MRGQRIIITIAPDDKLWLESYSKANKISKAEAIRQGIRKLRQLTKKDTYETLVETTRHLWCEEDGLKYQERLRSEWHDQ
jgi:hypothetical protein